MASVYQAIAILAFVGQTAPSAAVSTGVQSASDSASTVAAPKPQVVQLQRESVLLPKTGRRKNFYSAKVKVGVPAQEFRMNFDLGGGTFVLPSEACHDPACLERRRYDRDVSKTAYDIQANGELISGS